MPKKKETVSTGWGEAWGIILLAAALLSALSLFSYDSGDISVFQTPPNSPPVNFIGPLGAWFSFILFMSVGGSAYVLPFVLAVFGVFYILQKTGQGWFKVLWTSILVLSLSLVMELQAEVWEGIRARLNAGTPGGLIGDLVGHRVLVPLLGEIGTGILSAALLITSLIFLFEIHPGELFLQAKGRFQAWYGALQERRASLMDEKSQLELEQKKLEKERKRLEQELSRQAFQKERSDRKSRKQVDEEEESRPVKPLPILPGLGQSQDAEQDNEPEPPPEKKKKSRILPALKRDKKEKAPEPKREPAPVVLSSAGKDDAPDEKKKRPEDDPIPEGAPIDPETYQLPPLDLLDPLPEEQERDSAESLQAKAGLIQEKLAEFGVEAQVVNAVTGPTVTRFEIMPAAGVKVERIAGLDNNLALALKAESLRIQAPVPGKGVVGIEVPNASKAAVYIREIIEHKAWKKDHALPLALGKDVAGNPLIADLAEMPHLLIAGSTGAGKTVCMNSILAGLLMSRTPEELKLILVDPKIVEFTGYNHLPHLVVPVITDAKKVPHGLRWAVDEMKKRYELFGKVGVRNIKAFNSRPVEEQQDLFGEEGSPEGEDAPDPIPNKLPYIVIIVDELADLMLVAQAEIENYIARLAQLSRAVGIHMILATQRPSVNVITGTIKANLPARVAFKVAQANDSRTILDANGAEQLLGKGDMLFAPPGSPQITRGQGAWTKDHEIKGVVDFIKAQGAPQYEMKVQQKLESKAVDLPDSGEDDELLESAIEIIRQTQRASTSSLQRRLRIGYTRAARLMDLLEEKGLVGPPNGSEPREILIDLDGEIPSNAGQPAAVEEGER